MLLIGTEQTFEGASFGRRAVSAVGRVVPAPGAVGTTSGAHPVVEFPVPGHPPVRYRQDGMGERPIGSPVPLLYDAADPAGTAIARSFWTRWGSEAAALAVGLALVAFALASGELAMAPRTRALAAAVRRDRSGRRP
jgi:hypothetical protein